MFSHLKSPRNIFQHRSTVLLRGFKAKSIIALESPQGPFMEPIENSASFQPTQEQIDDESRRIRRLRILVQLTLESIAAGDLTPEEAAGMRSEERRVGKECR